jgi:hypothetical protein
MPSIINASTSNGLIQSADTSGTLQLQSAGTTKFTVDSTGAYGQLQSGTSQATSSGTTKSFTGIPSWVKRITVIYNGINTNGNNHILVQLGSGSIQSTGYLSYWGYYSGGSTGSTTSSSAGFGVWHGSTSDINYANMIITNISGNTWVSSHSGAFLAGTAFVSGGGNVTLSGTLDRIQLATTSTDTFSGSGSVNILYE